MLTLNPTGKGDWIAYSLRYGVAVVRHCGTAAECVDAVQQHPDPPLYVKQSINLPARLDVLASKRKAP